MSLRIECPTCATSYTSERLGIKGDKQQHITTVCAVCGVSFDAKLSPTVSPPPLTWYERIVLRRRQPQQPSHIVEVEVHRGA